MDVDLHQVKYFIRHFFTARRKGHGVHSPFAYELCEEVFYNKDAFYHFEQLNKVRSALLKNETTLEITDLGAGSKAFGKIRRIKDIASKGISTKKQSEILYRLANFLKCDTLVELGSSLGLNSVYMALVKSNSKVYSLEGDKALLKFAIDLAERKEIKNIEFIGGNFDHTFPLLLSEVDKIDLLYVDGNHTYNATMNYFKQALEKKHNNSVFIFDDIYWSPGMTKAWNEIKNHSSVTMSLDTFYSGFIFFKEEIKEKVALRIFV